MNEQEQKLATKLLEEALNPDNATSRANLIQQYDQLIGAAVARSRQFGGALDLKGAGDIGG